MILILSVVQRIFTYRKISSELSLRLFSFWLTWINNWLGQVKKYRNLLCIPEKIQEIFFICSFHKTKTCFGFPLYHNFRNCINCILQVFYNENKLKLVQVMLSCSAKMPISKKGLNMVFCCSIFAQLAFTCLRSTMEMQESRVKSLHS